MVQDWLAYFIETYGPLITPGAILIPAAVAVGVMIYNANIARKRSTVDLVLHMWLNTTLIEARKTFNRLREDKAQFSEYALLENRNSKENICVLEVLNFNEFIAVGIFEKAFDEKTFKRLSRSRYIKDWDTLETYVSELRKSRGFPIGSVLFTEFEGLAKRWKADPLKAKQ